MYGATFFTCCRSKLLAIPHLFQPAEAACGANSEWKDDGAGSDGTSERAAANLVHAGDECTVKSPEGFLRDECRSAH